MLYVRYVLLWFRARSRLVCLDEMGKFALATMWRGCRYHLPSFLESYLTSARLSVELCFTVHIFPNFSTNYTQDKCAALPYNLPWRLVHSPRNLRYAADPCYAQLGLRYATMCPETT